MNVPTKLGVFAAALLIVFAAAYAIAAGVAPDRPRPSSAESTHVGHTAQPSSSASPGADQVRGVSLAAGGFILGNVVAPHAPGMQAPLSFEILDAAGAARQFDDRRGNKSQKLDLEACAALTVGEQTVRWSTDSTGSEEDAGIFAFSRQVQDGSSYALVVFNTHTSKESVSSSMGTGMMTGLPDGTTLVDVLSPDQATYSVGAGGTLAISLPPMSGAILVPQDQVKPGL